ncbi:hypothetical protein DYI37_07095 [Fulvimarina endophytica]|uniref:TRAP transporter small permease protein n=1 Tax=Fulvimarina endophytica TaxID=2293836 RepID=A0A371X4F9_9HYPH|nr:TRAP transporter small permease subunit [Fulvimarina endophytica]RFC64122.1 hypothetical protein DYI37_07095 [Fulvimarina endophytica]
MGALLGVARAIDRVNGWIGRLFAWLILVAVLVSAGNAVVRKSFNLSSNAWLEAQWYLFGAVFMMCAAWTLRENEHVRVDVLSQILSPRARVRIDLICHILFLLPFAGMMVWLGWPFFINSFLSGEQSSNASGLIRWPAKIWVLAGFVSFLAQGVSEIIKSGAILKGDLPMPGEAAEDHGSAPIAQNAADRT